MAAKKPSAKAGKAAKTVSAKPAAKAASKTRASKAKSATKAKAPAKTAARKAPATPRPKAKAKSTRPVAPRQATVEVEVGMEEAEGMEFSPNLLAGPRNVQPYVVRKGEEYMSKEQLEHFRNILLTWKQDLMQEVDELPRPQ